MATNDASRSALTGAELVRLSQALQLEERLAHWFALGAAECGQAQLRGYFAHQAERGGERLDELARTLQAYAGAGRAYPNTGVYM
ncbi:hypothetical protein [Paenibacillus sp.]|uniref:hypothetical protein n=1 Tax=Paenibacillus sp. TaxID=58172 RepID=UPI002D3FF5B7|nr:hypothetical protein [Paenibacillus sp.]HZG87458.1 hypothetical protein [Paenibacillus sp.]